jgi:hypothetical protein
MDFFEMDGATLQQAEGVFEEIKGKLCTKEQYTPSKKMPLSCAGPNITLSVQGGHCIITKAKKVICKPPKVVLIKTPGECVIKHSTPVTIKGHECKLKKKFGKEESGLLFGNKTVWIDVETVGGRHAWHQHADGMY